MFDRVQVRTLAGPIKDIQTLVPSHSFIVLAVCLGSLSDVVHLLEVEHLPQSEVLSALEKVLIKDFSVLCSVHLSLDPD